MPKTDMGGVLARWMLARDESVRSSVIEGVGSTADGLAWARYREQTGQPVTDANEALTLGASRQLAAAVDLGEQLRNGRPCTADDILSLHAALFEDTQERDLGGALREEPIWIGPADCLIEEATFVPPPPEYVPDLAEDLVGYLNTSDHPAVLQAAVAHAQFETVHPFEDGNGRTGRALVHTVLNARGLVDGAIPISAALERDRADYYESLNATRVVCDANDSAARSQGFAPWMDVFGAACEEAHAQATVTVRAVEEMASGWEQKSRFRSDSAAASLMRLLPSMPILDAEMIADRLGVSRRVGRTALNALAKAGIVTPVGGRRNARFAVPEMVSVLRRMNPDGAVPAGSPSMSRPATDAERSPSTLLPTKCGFRGPRSQRPCVLARGHAGQHRYQ
ncbi:Fic family protein [Candidatus Poriferisodalis sp.]|uniref:Fic family protein n=1 Tax=Candidatus Poriferisodalis sp. TaxID=3101277 RepID=UPI003B023AA5